MDGTSVGISNDICSSTTTMTFHATTIIIIVVGSTITVGKLSIGQTRLATTGSLWRTTTITITTSWNEDSTSIVPVSSSSSRFGYRNMVIGCGCGSILFTCASNTTSSSIAAVVIVVSTAFVIGSKAGIQRSQTE